MTLTLAAVLAYVAVQLGIGAYVSRRIQTEEDYLVAGRRLGYGLTTFTVFATWFGAETCIGAAGAIYSEGLSGGAADPFGYGICLLLMGLVFAAPLWRRRLTTLADVFRRRYSPRVEQTAVLLMIPTSVLWGAAQIRAFGQVLSASSTLTPEPAITIAAAVVIVYTVSGGLLADAWTDLIQGVVLIGSLVLVGALFLKGGGAEALGQVPPERYRILGDDPFTLGTLETWAIPICGSVLSAELVARVIAARSPQVAQCSTLIAAGGYLAIGMLPVAMGLAGAVLHPGLAEPEQILPVVARAHLPGWAYAVFAGALVSAILSTVDSALLVAGSLLSHNLIVPLLAAPSERVKVRIARLAVAGFGVVAYVMAISAEGVFALVEEASAFGSAGVFLVLLFGLFTRFGGPRSALAALVLGVAAWVGGAYLTSLPYPYLLSLGAALAGYVGGALFEQRPGRVSLS